MKSFREQQTAAKEPKKTPYVSSIGPASWPTLDVASRPKVVLFRTVRDPSDSAVGADRRLPAESGQFADRHQFDGRGRSLGDGSLAADLDVNDCAGTSRLSQAQTARCRRDRRSNRRNLAASVDFVSRRNAESPDDLSTLRVMCARSTTRTCCMMHNGMLLRGTRGPLQVCACE